MRAQLPIKLRRGSLFLCLACLSACDLPTESPIFETRWTFPIEGTGTTIAVAELLPSSVTISGGEFQVAVDPFSFVETLGGLCSICAEVNGLTVPKPQFQFAFSDVTSLPADVESVNLSTGSLTVRVTNNLGFDPIRPGVGVTGTLTITVYDATIGGRQLDQVILDGTVDALPNGTAVDVPVSLAAGVVSSTIVAVVAVDSPLGDPVLVDTGAQLNIGVTFGVIAATSATIDASGQVIAIDQVAMDVEKIDSDIVENIVSGAVVLDITNPFGVALNVTIDIGGPTIQTISKAVSITSDATSQARLEYTSLELQTFLGQMGVTIGGSGTVDAGAGSAVVTPLQVAVIDTSVDAVVEIGR
jgi:hypothetical protein